MNWLSQILAIVSFSLRSIPQRLGSSITAAVGIAGVVLVLTGVLAIAEGIKKTLTATGAPDIAVVLRSGSDSEMNSGLSREETRLIADSPGIAIAPQTPEAVSAPEPDGSTALESTTASASEPAMRPL